MSVSSKSSSQSSETELLVVLCTVPDKVCAERIAARLVNERFAACVNIIPGIESVYEWEGKIERDREVLLLIKTPPSAFDSLQQKLVQLHPYDTPEVIGVPVELGLQDYLSWARQAVATPS